MIGDEQLMYPNKLMVWTKNTAELCEGGGIREERNRTPLFGHLRRTGDRRSAMVKHTQEAIAHDYCISEGNRCQQKKRAPAGNRCPYERSTLGFNPTHIVAKAGIAVNSKKDVQPCQKSAQP